MTIRLQTISSMGRAFRSLRREGCEGSIRLGGPGRGSHGGMRNLIRDKRRWPVGPSLSAPTARAGQQMTMSSTWLPCGSSHPSTARATWPLWQPSRSSIWVSGSAPAWTAATTGTSTLGSLLCRASPAHLRARLAWSWARWSKLSGSTARNT